MTAQLAPSALARRIAAQQWPDVQHSRKITNGVFEYDCAGHGGIVAILDAVDEGMIPAGAIEAGKREGVVVEYVAYRAGGRIKLGTSDQYPINWDEWVQWATAHGWVVAKGLAWVGEEDTAWSTLVTASDAMTEAYIQSRRGHLTVPFEQWAAEFATYPRECAQRWHPEYVAALAAV